MATLKDQVAALTASMNAQALVLDKLIQLQTGSGAAMDEFDDGAEAPEVEVGEVDNFVIVPHSFRWAKVGEKVKATRSGRVFVKLDKAAEGRDQRVSVTFSKNDPTKAPGTFTGKFMWVETERGNRPCVVF